MQKEIKTFFKEIKANPTVFLHNLEDKEVIQSRPMHALIKDGDLENLYFLTSLDSNKVEEILEDRRLKVTMSNHKGNFHAAIYGEGFIMTQRSDIPEEWSQPAKVWFEDGLDDSNLGVIKFKIHKLEYWDSEDSLLKRGVELLMARLSDQRPDLGGHKSVQVN